MSDVGNVGGAFDPMSLGFPRFEGCVSVNG